MTADVGFSFEAAEQACRDEGLTPFRVEFGAYGVERWGSLGQVQSVETYGPSTFNHAKFCCEIKVRDAYHCPEWEVK